MKNSSSFKRTFCDGWDLLCDQSLPKICYPAEKSGKRSDYIFNPLYTLPLWAALAAVIAGLAGRFLAAFLPAKGAALIFAIIMFAACEMRTTFRGMALSVSFLEKLLYGKGFTASALHRQDDLRNINGLPALLLAAAFAGCKFFALYWSAKSGNYGVAGAAWLIALAAEGFLAGEPAAENMPSYCVQAKSEYIVGIAGFFLLFNLINQPLATLIAAGVSAALVILMMNLLLKNTGRITSNDMTMTGYWLETAVFLIFAVMIG